MWRLHRSLSDRDAMTLLVHGPEFRSGELLVLNPDVFPDVEEHDLVEIVQSERRHPQLVLSVESLAPVRGKVQVSIARDIAAQFGLEPFRGVSVRRVQTQRDVVVAFVELSFKDQFLSRADVWRFKVTMLGHCVYVGRTVECIGIRGQVDAILSPSKTHVLCGVIGDATKIVVRSRSSRLFWLVQMSTEMWEVAPEDGQVYYEKMLHDFLSVQSRKWTESSVSHSVTIMTFCRTFYDVDQFPDGFDPTRAPFVDPRRQGVGPGCGAPGVHVAQGYGPTIHVDPISGRYYEDFYKVVVMNFTGPDWSRLLLLLKKEFATYYEIHRWRTPEEKSPAHYEICRCPKQANVVDRAAAAATTLNTGDRECADSEDVYVKWIKLPCGVPSRAKDGNILEAINVTLNVLDKHYMDRDLCRTGQGVVMITAGCSIFNVDSKLAEITEQRMMDSGVGMDMISLSTPPLHVVPLFIYRDGLLEKAATANTWTPSSLHKLSFHKVLGEELMSFEAGSPSHGIPSLHSSSLPKTSEWAQAGSDVLRRTLKSAARTTATADRSEDSGEKLTYDVPHWVNLTFLEFSCSCEQASHNYGSAQPPATPNSNQHVPHEKQGGRAWHSSSCKTKRNERFHPLPSFRMFDITSPSEKLVFPAMLRNLMRGKSKDGPSSGSVTTPTSVQRDEEADWSNDSVNRGVSVFANAIAPIKSLGNQRQLSYTTTKLLDPIASTPPLEQLQLSRSPDFDPVLASSQLCTNLSGRLHMRAALTAYDENVFSSVARDSGFAADRHFRDRRLGFATPGINEEHDDVTSVTFANDGRLERFLRDVRKEAEQRSSTGNMGSFRKGKSVLSDDDDSVVQTLLLPRKLSNNAITVGRADRSVATAPRILSKDDTSLTCSLAVPLANSIDRSRYGMPLEKRGKDCRPTAHAAAKVNDLQSMFGPSPAISSPPGSDGFIGRSRSNLRQFSNTGSPLGLRRNQSDFFKAPLVPGSLSFKALLGTQPAHTPVGERKAIINPFSYAKAHGYKRLSSDRQRWSHLFPTSSHGTHCTVDNTFSEAVVHDDEPMFVGPNWTSLTSPAILPLTTDHFPSPQELRQGYSEAFYTLTLPTTAIQAPTVECVPRYRNHDELLTEMICQRLACDFQLVSSYESPSSIVGNESRPESRQRVFHLSMGHRIHQLIYDAERQTVEVKRFVQREPHDLKVAYTSYTYSLWVGLTQLFQPHQQLFHRYPQPEDNWNALDNLLCGYLDDMADGTKCRRVRFAIVPPVCAKSVGDGDLLTLYASNFTKFIVYLQSRVAPSEFGDHEHIDIRMVLNRPGDTEETEKAVPLTESRMLSFKMACKVSTSTASPSSAPKKKLKDSRTEWVVMRLEETMDVSRCYHLDVRWLACSGVAADDFVGTIRRRAKQVGLDLRRVPEYSSVSRVQIHPLIASVFLPLPVKVLESFAVVLTRTLGFVLDDERIADGTGIGYGLSIGNEPTAAKPRVSTRRHRRSASTTARLLLESWRQRGYKQLMHRNVPVFVRIIHDGLIWIPGYDYDRKADGAVSSTAVETLFREVCTTIESQCADCLGHV